MSREIKYFYNLFPFLYLLLLGSSPTIFAQNSITPKIIKIEIFNSDNGSWINQTSSFLQKQSLIFDESNSNLKITLEEIDSIYVDQIQYSYRLGSSNPWIHLENNVVDIQNILHGRSTLQLRKKNSNGNWSSSQIEIQIYRQQPFYFRHPFLVSVLLVFITIIIFIRKWIKKQNVSTEFLIKDSSPTLEEKVSSPRMDNIDQEPSSLTKDMQTDKTIDEWEEMVHKSANSLIDDGKFSIIELATSMNLSERQFRRKLKQKTGLRPVDYMREIRLLKAKDFLRNNTYSTVAEVCFSVGFSTPKHFSKIFKERFGKKPSYYLNKRKLS